MSQLDRKYVQVAILKDESTGYNISAAIYKGYVMLRKENQMLEKASPYGAPRSALMDYSRRNMAGNIRRYRSKIAYAAQLTTKVVRLTYQRKHMKVSVQIGLDFIKSNQLTLGSLWNDLRLKIRDEREMNRPVGLEEVSIPVPSTGRYLVESLAGGRGGVYLQPGVILKRLAGRRAAKVFLQKYPQDNRRHVGVEIEFYSREGKENIASALVAAGLTQYACLKDDGSINPPHGYMSHELNLIAPLVSIRRVLKAALSVLSSFDSGVNASCGLHVHLDMRQPLAKGQSGVEEVQKAFGNLVIAHRFLVNMLPQSRRSNQYCALNPTRRISYRNRYRMVNGCALRTYRTIEIRSHSSTLNVEKIWNWILILERLASAPAIARAPRSLSRFMQIVKLSKRLSSYIMARMALFNGDNAQVTEEINTAAA